MTKKLPLPRFEVAKSEKNKEWFWRYLAKNGKEIARSSETYKRKGAANRSLDTMKLNVRTAQAVTIEVK